MSGGHFDYQQYRLHDMATEIKRLIESNDKPDAYDDTSTAYGDAVLQEFQNAVEALRKAEIYVNRIDWLLSGDDSEESFHERLKEELTIPTQSHNIPLDPDMPAEQLLLHMGELTASEIRVARAAIRWANATSQLSGNAG